MCSKLFQEQQPFGQAILQSGVASRNIKTLAEQQKNYDAICVYFGLQGDSEDRLQKLREISAEDLVKAYIALGTPVPTWLGTLDGYLLDQQTEPSSLPSLKYPPSIKRLLLGDCLHEGLIFKMPTEKQELDFEKIKSRAEAIFGPEDVTKIFQAYGISPGQDRDQLLESIFAIITDGAWSQPIEAVGRSFKNGDVFYYHVMEGNPFDGPNKG